EGEYIANAAQRGEQLRQGLLKLQRQHPQIGDVRGLGLMVAMDLVKDRDRPTADLALRDELVQAAFRRGLLLWGWGKRPTRLSPPLCINAQQVETALQILTGLLSERQPSKIAV